MTQPPSFEAFIKENREKKKNEALAQEYLGRGRKGPAAGSARNAPEKPSLLSRISGGAGVQKRSSSAKPAGNIDAIWKHDLHPLNNARGTAARGRGPAARGRGISRPASASQLDRNSRTFDKFASTLNRSARSNLVADNNATGFNIRGVANGGPYTVIASNFAPGTTAADIDAVMTPHAGETLGCRLISASPTVMVELHCATKEGAENVIATFNNQKADGRLLYVYLKDKTTTTQGQPPRQTQSFGDDMDIDTKAGARNGSFQDSRFGFSEGGRRDPPRGPRRRF